MTPEVQGMIAVASICITIALAAWKLRGGIAKDRKDDFAIIQTQREEDRKERSEERREMMDSLRRVHERIETNGEQSRLRQEAITAKIAGIDTRLSVVESGFHEHVRQHKKVSEQ